MDSMLNWVWILFVFNVLKLTTFCKKKTKNKKKSKLLFSFGGFFFLEAQHLLGIGLELDRLDLFDLIANEHESPQVGA